MAARSLSLIDRTSPPPAAAGETIHPPPDDESDENDDDDDNNIDDDGSVASKILGCSGRTSGASPLLSKSISSPSLLLSSALNANHINSTIMSSCKETVRETPYQKILKLKKMKLHQCAEEIGSESSSSDYISYSATISDKSALLITTTPLAAEPVGGGGGVAPPELIAQTVEMAADCKDRSSSDYLQIASSDSDPIQRQLPPLSENRPINRSYSGISSVKSAPNLCDLPLHRLADAVLQPDAADHSRIDGGPRCSWALPPPPPPGYGGGFSWMAATDTIDPNLRSYNPSSISIASTPPTGAPRRRKPFPPPLAVVSLSTGYGGTPPFLRAHRENGRLILRVSCGGSTSSSGAAPIEVAAAADSIHPSSVPKSGDSDVHSGLRHVGGGVAPDVAVKSEIQQGASDPSLVRAHLPNGTYGTAGNSAVSIPPISKGNVLQLNHQNVAADQIYRSGANREQDTSLRSGCRCYRTSMNGGVEAGAEACDQARRMNDDGIRQRMYGKSIQMAVNVENEDD